MGEVEKIFYDNNINLAIGLCQNFTKFSFCFVCLAKIYFIFFFIIDIFDTGFYNQFK